MNDIDTLIEQQRQPMQFDKFVAEAEKVKSLAESMEIVDQRTADDMNSLLYSIGNAMKSVRALTDPFVKSSDQLHKYHCATRNKLLAPFEDADKVVKAKLAVWTDEQSLLTEAAQKKADEDAQIAAAAKAADSGLNDLADAVMSGQVVVTGAPVAKVSHTFASASRPWTFEIVDESIIPREYMIPDRSAIGALVRARKGNVDIPGVKVFQHTNIKRKGNNLKGR